MIAKLIYKILLLLALGVCVFLFIAYSDLLDFFPWGNRKSYVIWEPLVAYFIVPSFISVGILRLLFSKGGNSILANLLFFIIGLILSIPILVGFDLETDLAGRWMGVFTALLSILLIIIVMYQEISRIVQNKE